MFSVHNVIMAAAVVGMVGNEGNIIRKVLIPATYYLLLTGAIGYVILIGFGLNMGTFVLVAMIATIFIAIWKNQDYYKNQDISINKDLKF